MKEEYYNFENIDLQASKFLKIVEPYRKKHKFELNKTQIALLVLDMQKFFLNENSHAYIPSSKAIIPKIKKLQEFFLNHNLTVIQTRHLNTIKDAGQMVRWWNDLITIDNPLSIIIDELVDNRIEIIHKTQYDAFFNTNLEEILKNKGVKQILITGVMAHLCCETTARSAFMRNFEVFFVIDGTATYNRNFHLATLLNLSHGFAIPILTQEIINFLKNEN
ncbi:MAG: isochorismatase family protein [Candidatus Desulfofervidus auxilii]|nr:isochorismatase family protein [Candidatus Desulfofervidus auxilii]